MAIIPMREIVIKPMIIGKIRFTYNKMVKNYVFAKI
jgi:hypothetical protein